MKLGFLYTLSVPYAAGLACLGGPMVGGFRLTGWVFVIMLAAAPIVFLLDRSPSRFPAWIWLPWITIVILSLMWADGSFRKSVQDVLQMMTPFVIAPIASKSIKSTADIDALLRAFTHCVMILLSGLVLNAVIGVGILARPMAMTAALSGCVFLSQIHRRRNLAICGWCGCLAVAGITGSRMATLVILLEWLLLPTYRRHGARVVAAGLMTVIAVALFYTPVFQERFFADGEGTLSDVASGEFSDTGRFEVWRALWPEVTRRPLLGAGARGSASLVRKTWDGLDKPHNDFLRILLEQGIIGLSLFLLGVLGQLISLWNQRFSSTDPRSVFRSAAYMGIMVFLLMALTDNPIVYGVWFTHPLFVLIGASYSQVQEPD